MIRSVTTVIASLVAVGIVLGVLLAPGHELTPAEAHGVADQSQTQSNQTGFNSNVPQQQSFKPTAGSLLAVDVKLSSAFSDYPDLVWTVAIRSSFRFGPIIGLQTMKGLTYNDAIYHVDFPSPIAVTPGDTYWLEVSGEFNYLQWSFQSTGNPYANGSPDSDLTTAYANADRYFVTYGAPAVTPSPSPTPIPTARPTRTPRFVAVID